MHGGTGDKALADKIAEKVDATLRARTPKDNFKYSGGQKAAMAHQTLARAATHRN
jgi:hypothetical protein